MFSGSLEQAATVPRTSDRISMIHAHLERRPVTINESSPLRWISPMTEGITSPQEVNLSSSHVSSAGFSTHDSRAHSTLLPSFAHIASVADRQGLQYMRAPSIGSEYVQLPLLRDECAYSSPALSPLEETSLSPLSSSSSLSNMPSPALTAINEGVESRSITPSAPSRSCRSEKVTKSSKQKTLPPRAARMNDEVGRRIDEIQACLKNGQSSCFVRRDSHTTPLFSRMGECHHPRDIKRALTATGRSDPQQRHNVAQTYLRGEKGSHLLTSQRLLFGVFGWRGGKLQTKVNARSSGLLYEGKDLTQACNNLMYLCSVLLEVLFDEEGLQKLGEKLSLFEPEEVRPEAVIRDKEDDDKTYEFKQHGARVKVMEEVMEPLGLKGAQTMDEVCALIREHIIPLANADGKKIFQKKFCNERSKI